MGLRSSIEINVGTNNGFYLFNLDRWWLAPQDDKSVPTGGLE